VAAGPVVGTVVAAVELVGRIFVEFVVSAADTVVELAAGLRSFDCLLGILV